MPLSTGSRWHVHDLLAEGNEFPDGRTDELVDRTISSVPLLRGESIGFIVLRRTEVSCSATAD